MMNKVHINLLTPTVEKIKTLLEREIISGGAKLENGKIVVASLEKSNTVAGAEVEVKAE